MERYIVVSNGEKDQRKYSILRQIREGISKQGTPYAFIDEKTFMKEEEIIPLGTIVTYERKRSTDKPII